MDKIHFSNVKQTILQLDDCFSELNTIADKIIKDLGKIGLKNLSSSSYVDNGSFFLFFTDDNDDWCLFKTTLEYGSDYFRFYLVIKGDSKNINIDFVKKTIVEYGIDTIYKKIENHLDFIKNARNAISIKLKDKGFQDAMVSFNYFRNAFKIKTSEEDASWHETMFNDVRFDIACSDKTLEFLVKLLSKEYIEIK